MNKHIVNYNTYKDFLEIKNYDTKINLKEHIENIIYSKHLYELIDFGIFSINDFQNYNLNESFRDFTSKLKDKALDISKNVLNKVKDVVSNIKNFIESVAEFIKDILETSWNATKKNLELYAKNIADSAKNIIDFSKKEANREIDWIKEILAWFSDNFVEFVTSLFKKSVAEGVDESLENYNQFTKLFENDEEELANDEEVENMFSKMIAKIKKSRAFQMIEKLFEILYDVSKAIDKVVEKNVNKALIYISKNLAKLRGIPQPPDEFVNTSKLFTLCVNKLASEVSVLNKDLLDSKKLGLFLLKKFTKLLLKGVVPGVDIFFLALKVRKYFVLFGTVLKHLTN